MNNYYLGISSHWLEMDLYSTTELQRSDIDKSVIAIKNNLQAYIQSKIDPGDHSSLTINLYTNEATPLIHHLVTDLHVFTINPESVSIIAGGGSGLAAIGVPRQPPPPPGPPIIDTLLLHPVPFKYNLSAAVANIFDQKKELGFNKALAQVKTIEFRN